MRLLIMRHPGEGKGTQSSMNADKYNIPHISTGEIFRESIDKKSAIGVIAKKHIDKGELVPDDVTNKFVQERLNQPDCKNGYLLDGYPRTLAQAKAFDETDVNIDIVLNIDIPKKHLIERIVGRRVCPNCGAGYHIKTLKPKVEGICDVCGYKLIQRKDDNEKTFKHRLEVYKRSTKPLLEFYNDKGLVKNINGEGSIEEIFNNIELVLGGMNDNTKK